MSLKILTSVSGIISLLEEENNDLKTVALNRMDSLNMVNEYWAEISPHIRELYFFKN